MPLCVFDAAPMLFSYLEREIHNDVFTRFFPLFRALKISRLFETLFLLLSKTFFFKIVAKSALVYVACPLENRPVTEKSEEQTWCLYHKKVQVLRI